MKATDFMLGNIVAHCAEQTPNAIAALEDGIVHLENNKFPDDERDIEGLPLTDWIMGITNGETKGKIQASIKGVHFSFVIKHGTKKTILVFSLNSSSCDILLIYMHQLQNLVFVLAGQPFDQGKWDFVPLNNR